MDRRAFVLDSLTVLLACATPAAIGRDRVPKPVPGSTLAELDEPARVAQSIYDIDSIGGFMYSDELAEHIAEQDARRAFGADYIAVTPPYAQHYRDAWRRLGVRHEWLVEAS